MKARALVAVGLSVIAVAIGAAWVGSSPTRLEPTLAAALASPGNAEAGRIVFFAGGCDSCHMTPGQSDPLRLGGGLELKTPFGSFFPPNISPDPKDGIGAWSAAEFGEALFSGVSPRGEHYFPAFPFTSYRHMSVVDARDLYAFLRTVPAIQGKAPEHRLTFPFSIRRAVGLWKRLYLDAEPPPLSVDQSDLTSFGGYLVNGPGHCAECHSPRDLFGGVVASRRLTGGPMPDGKGKAPDITAAGLKEWSEEDVSEALSSGFTPSGDSLGSAMAAVVRNTAQLPPRYRQAIARYLESLGAHGRS